MKTRTWTAFVLCLLCLAITFSDSLTAQFADQGFDPGARKLTRDEAVNRSAQVISESAANAASSTAKTISEVLAEAASRSSQIISESAANQATSTAFAISEVVLGAATSTQFTIDEVAREGASRSSQIISESEANQATSTAFSIAEVQREAASRSAQIISESAANKATDTAFAIAEVEREGASRTAAIESHNVTGAHGATVLASNSFVIAEVQAEGASMTAHVSGSVATHSALTTGVHGVSGSVASFADVSNKISDHDSSNNRHSATALASSAFVLSEISAHNASTTFIHGFNGTSIASLGANTFVGDQQAPSGTFTENLNVQGISSFSNNLIVDSSSVYGFSGSAATIADAASTTFTMLTDTSGLCMWEVYVCGHGNSGATILGGNFFLHSYRSGETKTYAWTGEHLNNCSISVLSGANFLTIQVTNLSGQTMDSIVCRGFKIN